MDLVISENKSKNHYMEFHCHSCRLIVDVNVNVKYHPYLNREYNLNKKGRGFS